MPPKPAKINDKIQKIFQYIYTIIGLVMVLGTWQFLYKPAIEFNQNAREAEATVINIKSSGGRDPSYQTQFQFETKEGRSIIGLDPNFHNPPKHQLNQKIELLYDPANPSNAKLKGFMSLWGPTLITGGIGFLFLVIGGVLFLIRKNSQQKKTNLSQYGRRIKTKIITVELNKDFTVNEEHPYHIISEWKDPKTSKTYEFYSESVWKNPQPELKSSYIDVLIDPKNPNKYSTDISFLS